MQTITLDDIRKEFPNANYAPYVDCEYCSGTGGVGPLKEIVITNDGAHTEINYEKRQPCICIYIGGDERINKIVVDGLKELAKQQV